MAREVGVDDSVTNNDPNNPIQLVNQQNTSGTTYAAKWQFNSVDAFVMRQNSAAGGFTDFRVQGVSNAPPIISLIAPNGTDYGDITHDGNNMEVETAKGDLNLRVLAATGNVNVWSTAQNTKLRVGNQNFGSALDMQHNGTNALISTTTGVLNLVAGTATPAGGSTTAGVAFGSSGPGMYWGSGAPTLSAGQGSLYMRTDGSSTSTRMYINTNGTTGWAAVTTAT